MHAQSIYVFVHTYMNLVVQAKKKLYANQVVVVANLFALEVVKLLG